MSHNMLRRSLIVKPITFSTTTRNKIPKQCCARASKESCERVSELPRKKASREEGNNDVVDKKSRSAHLPHQSASNTLAGTHTDSSALAQTLGILVDALPVLSAHKHHQSLISRVCRRVESSIASSLAVRASDFICTRRSHFFL